MSKTFYGSTLAAAQTLLVAGAKCGGNATVYAQNANPSIGGVPNAIAATAVEPPYCQIFTSSTQNTQQYFLDNGNAGSATGFPFNLSILLYSVFRNQLVLPFTGRIWIGFSDAAGNAGTMFSGNPAQNYCAFRFSPLNGDTTWKIVCAFNAANQTVVDTGIVPDALGHVFKIVPGPNGTNIAFYYDGNLVGIINSTLPLNITNMRNFISIDNFAGVATGVVTTNVAYSFWVTTV